jgi:hypothetical protein
VAVLSLFAVLFVPSVALAGTSTVSGCDGSGRINGWRATATPGYGTAYGGCPGYPGTGVGLIARSVGAADRVPAPPGSYAAQSFWAPAGTRVVGFSAYYKSYGAYPWVPGIRDSQSGQWINCSLVCPFLVDRWTYMSYPGLSLRGIQILVVCWTSGCRRDGENYGRAQLSYISVALADDWRPVVATTGGTLVDGRWHRGLQTLGYSARDNAGIRRVRTLVDGRVVGRSDLGCRRRQSGAAAAFVSQASARRGSMSGARCGRSARASGASVRTPAFPARKQACSAGLVRVVRSGRPTPTLARIAKKERAAGCGR